jgi:hypothetical protein
MLLMVIVFVVLAVAIIFVIAAVAIGREAGRLDAQPPRPVFDMDEAVEWIGDRLPFEVSAELSHDDVRTILLWSLEHYRASTLTANGHGPDHQDARIVVGEAETLAYVLDRSRAAGLAWDTGHVRAVLDAQLAYLEAIGAVGPADDG